MGILTRFALNIAATAALLTGCDGSPLPIAAPGAPTQSPPGATHANRDGSWMLPGAKSGKLLYVSGPGTKTVYVYSYPGAKLVGTLTGFVAPLGECSDKAGDVWIADDTSGNLGPGTMIEYAHGGTAPIAMLNDPDPPLNCSVDATTGNLAVASHYHSQRVVIYAKAKGSPQYHSAKDAGPWDCVYDSSGNLFVAATVGEYQSRLYWLSKGGKGLLKYSLSPSTFADGGVAWDGQHLVVTSNGSDLYLYTQHNRVGETIVKSLDISGIMWIQGSTLIAAVNKEVAFFAYPSGGYPFKVMNNSYGAGGVTVSV